MTSSACAEFRSSHPGDPADWNPEMYELYLDATLADQAAAARRVSRRAVRAAWITAEVTVGIFALAASSVAAVLMWADEKQGYRAPLSWIADIAADVADALCDATDRMSKRLFRLGRRHPNWLIGMFQEPENYIPVPPPPPSRPAFAPLVCQPVETFRSTPRPLYPEPVGDLRIVRDELADLRAAAAMGVVVGMLLDAVVRAAPAPQPVPEPTGPVIKGELIGEKRSGKNPFPPELPLAEESSPAVARQFLIDNANLISPLVSPENAALLAEAARTNRRELGA
ncbi:MULTISPECIES: hypothetical protein [unclassified Streptomyces]|uniref:hypothetical protein n=1 Tax=unclassified Streptomyces TaxID=2593676 RepID=UPI000DC786B7|nr:MULTISPECIES: hypothetical protein [unclassified Streptomyces]AWZ07715.1 hypothetical protein DRB89_27365 [Streptomyces sp. ICC4]AWZ12640.1 hypothetical protein DRB96_10255 [Streptomyces sp. ICC1]